MNKIAITLLFCVTLSTSFKPPSSWKKCNRKNENFNQCLAKAVELTVKHLNKPYKKLGIPTLEPLHLESISVDGGSGVVGFQQNFTYLDIFGLTKGKVEKFDIDFDSDTVILECLYDELKYEFEFAIDGTVMSIPLNGTGFGTVIMEKPRYVLTFLLDKYDKNGKEHYKVVNGKLAMDAKKLDTKLEKLFGDDKELEDNINKVFNDNWEIIFEQAKGNYEIILGKVFTAIFNNILGKVSISDLFGNP